MQQVAVANGGLENGIRREGILEAFSEYGELEDVVMPASRSFCFVKFCSVEEAVQAFKKLHCQLIPHPDISPIQNLHFFLAYVDKGSKILYSNLWVCSKISIRVF